MSTESKLVPTLIRELADAVCNSSSTPPATVPYYLSSLMTHIVVYRTKGVRCQALYIKWVIHFIQAHEDRLRMLLVSAWTMSCEDKETLDSFSERVYAHITCLLREAESVVRPLAENPKATPQEWERVWEEARRYDLESLYMFHRLSVAAE